MHLWARGTNESERIAPHENPREQNYNSAPVIFLARSTTRPAYITRCSCESIQQSAHNREHKIANQGSAFARCSCRQTYRLTSNFTETTCCNEISSPTRLVHLFVDGSLVLQKPPPMSSHPAHQAENNHILESWWSKPTYWARVVVIPSRGAITCEIRKRRK